MTMYRCYLYSLSCTKKRYINIIVNEKELIRNEYLLLYIIGEKITENMILLLMKLKFL